MKRSLSYLGDHFSVIRAIYHAVMMLLGTIVLMLIKIVRPIIRIRIGMINYTRIGHQAANTEYWLRKEYVRRNKGEICVLLSSPTPANRQLADMIKRKVPVIENNLLLAIYGYTRKMWPDSSVWTDLDTAGTHDYELWSNSNPQLGFTQAEESRGNHLLLSMGIPPGEPFICFAMRDKSYLERTQQRGEHFWRYHDYRDADIDNCHLMAEWLASKGVWVLRMGAVVEKSFQSGCHRIIDYANLYRSDFGDIYLLGHCKYFVGDTAGLFWPAGILGVPVALTNLVPITHLYPVPGSMVMPKKYRRSVDGSLISYSEVVEKGYDGFLMGQQYDEAGIDLVENTPEEILGMVKEMNARIDGTWISTAEDEELHQRFWSVFPKGHPSHGCPVRIPIDFLYRNIDLII